MKDYQLSDFRDERYMSAQQKYKAYKEFKSVIEKRDINLMDKNLYEHLRLHCGYIAHYDINGFKAMYSEPKDFLQFCENFLIQNTDRISWRSMEEYADVLQAMIEVLEQHIDRIRKEVENHETEQELKLLRLLAAKHGVKIQEPVKAGERLVML